jgi:hypothetical protein
LVTVTTLLIKNPIEKFTVTLSDFLSKQLPIFASPYVPSLKSRIRDSISRRYEVNVSTVPNMEQNAENAESLQNQANENPISQDRGQKGEPQDGGLAGWKCVLGSFFAVFSTFGWLNA